MPRGGARLLLGGPIAAEIRHAVAEDAVTFRERHGRAPGLAVVIVGRDAPSMVYLHQILRSSEKVGIEGRLVEIEGEASEARVAETVAGLNADATVDGIIVQMPLPASIRLRAIVDVIDPAKDIDGIHPLNAGLLRLGYDGFLPATAHAAVEILRRSGIEIEGRRAVVVGRSAVVGMPAAFLLVRENALMSGSIRVGYREIALERARGDVLVAMAQRDNVVPAGATEPALSLVGDPARREALRLPGGHVTFGTGKSAFKHTMPRLTEWITAHSDERPDGEEA